jgi:hypothetical protein
VALKQTAGLDALMHGGVVQITPYATVQYTDNGVAVPIAVLPAGALILEKVIDIDTQFNGSGTDLLDIGDPSDPDSIDADFDLAGTAGISKTAVDTLTHLAAETRIECTYTDQNSNASAGSAKVALIWMAWSSRDE